MHEHLKMRISQRVLSGHFQSSLLTQNQNLKLPFCPFSHIPLLRWVGLLLSPFFSNTLLKKLILLFFSFAFTLLGDQSAFDFFRQETSHSDVVIRTDAMNNLILVCSLMTPEKVRADMIPYLQSLALFSSFSLFLTSSPSLLF
jgi:hypothetical protein